MNYEELSKEELIGIIKENEEFSGKYGLIWDKEKEPEFIVTQCDREIPLLVEKESKSINGEGGYNLLIEGDNFHSLSVLNYTHKESIDVIYIDPPYNTGSDDFIYNDKFVEPEDGYRHSKWLNFMSKRLKLAWNLLKENGLIFISIDDNEFAQLKLLCDKIFGEKSFVKIINVELSATQGMKVKAAKQGNIVKNCEYILVYSKDGHKNIGINPLKDPVKYDSHYNKYLKKVSNGIYKEVNIMDVIKENEELVTEISTLKLTNISDIYEKTIKTKKWINENSEFICRIHDSVDVPEEIKNNYQEGLIYEYKSTDRDYLVSKDSNGEINQRILLSEKICLCDDFYNTFAPSRIRGDWWAGFYLDMGNVSKEGGISFDNGKKPVRLIKQLLKFTTNKDAVILDFFAGSGTTGQAVLELNKEDGGHRQFILCTNNELSKKLINKFKKENDITQDEYEYYARTRNPILEKFLDENGICSSKTYERIKNIIDNASLKYYKCDFVENSNNRDQLYFDLTERCIPMLCVKDNNYIEYKSTDEYVIYTNKEENRFSCVYYSLFGNKEEEFINLLENLEGSKSIYKFALGDDLDLSQFKNVKDYSIEPIPYKIVELYKRIVKLSREED